MWKYRKLEATNIRGICVICNRNPQKKKSGGLYRSICPACDLRLYVTKFKMKKGSSCNRCSFVALDPCQLDIHHKDHNHHNNDPNNLEILCANCHRLEHFGKALGN